jgi:hypothetical protein
MNSRRFMWGMAFLHSGVTSSTDEAGRVGLPQFQLTTERTAGP